MKYTVCFIWVLFFLVSGFLSLYGSYGGARVSLEKVFSSTEDVWLGEEGIFSRKAESKLPEESGIFRNTEEGFGEIAVDDDPTLSAPPPGETGNPQKIPIGENDLVACFLLFLAGCGWYAGKRKPVFT